jgi:hypothetical protein
MKADFEKLLTLACDELKKHNRETYKTSERDYRTYLKIVRLKEKGWNDGKIANKIYPGDVSHYDAVKKIRGFLKRGKKFRSEP